MKKYIAKIEVELEAEDIDDAVAQIENLFDKCEILTMDEKPELNPELMKAPEADLGIPELQANFPNLAIFHHIFDCDIEAYLVESKKRADLQGGEYIKEHTWGLWLKDKIAQDPDLPNRIRKIFEEIDKELKNNELK